MAQRDSPAGVPPDQRLAAFVDGETTGFSPARDEVIELAVILFRFHPSTGEGLGVVDEFSGLQEPSRPIPVGATAVHGITDDAVRGRALDHKRALGLLTRAEFLVAHNASFDRGFVVRMYPGLGPKPWMCSLRDIDWRRRAVVSQSLQHVGHARTASGPSAPRSGGLPLGPPAPGLPGAGREHLLSGDAPPPWPAVRRGDDGGRNRDRCPGVPRDEVLVYPGPWGRSRRGPLSGLRSLSGARPTHPVPLDRPPRPALSHRRVVPHRLALPPHAPVHRFRAWPEMAPARVRCRRSAPAAMPTTSPLSPRSAAHPSHPPPDARQRV